MRTKFEKIKVNLTKESLGIDVGVKDLAVCSNGKIKLLADVAA